MKVLLTAILMVLATSVQASFYADNEKVIALAASGEVTLELNSNNCPEKYGNPIFTDLLGSGAEYDRICVKTQELPENVKAELQIMKENEFENESDYDARLTRLYIFRQENFSASIDIDDLKQITEALGIPKSQQQGFRISAYIGNPKSLSHFEGIVIGDQFVEVSHTLAYLRSLIQGKLVFTIELGDGIELYPGGGFNVTHEIIIVDGILIYVKRSWWDS